MHRLTTFIEAKENLKRYEETKDFEYMEAFFGSYIFEYNKLESEKVFFYGCSFKNYIENYDSRLKVYNEKHPDALEIDFILFDFKVIHSKSFLSFISELFIHKPNIDFSIKKLKNFLNERANKLGYYLEREQLTRWEGDEFHNYSGEFTYFKDENYSSSKKQKLEWTASKTDFIELFKALVESKSINGTQIEIIEKAGEFFGVDTKNFSQAIQDISKRNNGSETKFLTSLNSTLLNYIQKK